MARRSPPKLRRRLATLVLLVGVSPLMLASTTRDFAGDLWLMLPYNLPETTEQGLQSRWNLDQGTWLSRQPCYESMAPFGLFDYYRQPRGRLQLPLVTIEQLQRLSGHEVWTENPIRSDADLNLGNGKTFARVNPSFVRWARKALIPGTSDSAFRQATQSRYLDCLAPGVRQLWLVREDMATNPTCTKTMREQYQAFVEREGTFAPPSARDWNCCAHAGALGYRGLSRSLVLRIGSTDHYDYRDNLDTSTRPNYLKEVWGMFDPSFGDVMKWWLRREMDGSAEEIALTLKALLRAYDPAWLTNHEVNAEDAEAGYLAALNTGGQTGLSPDCASRNSGIFGTGGLDNSVSNADGGLLGTGGLDNSVSKADGGLLGLLYRKQVGDYGQKGGGAPGVRVGDPSILGALDKSVIDRIVKEHMAQIRYCYQKELNKSPKLFGTLVVKFIVSKDGSVSSSSTKTSTLKNPIVENCINRRFMRMRFPHPRGGGIVIVSYPFVFNG